MGAIAAGAIKLGRKSLHRRGHLVADVLRRELNVRRYVPGEQPKRRDAGRNHKQQGERGEDHGQLGNAGDGKARIVDRLDSEILLLAKAQLAGAQVREPERAPS